MFKEVNSIKNFFCILTDFFKNTFMTRGMFIQRVDFLTYINNYNYIAQQQYKQQALSLQQLPAPADWLA